MATVHATVRTALSPTSLGGRVWLDDAPSNAALPYATLLPAIGHNPDLEGDAGTLADRELYQVDLWQARASEDDDLPRAVIAALDGLDLTGVPGGKRLRYVSSFRVRDPDPELIHHAITLTYVRSRVSA